MPKAIDITGQKFNRLLAIERVGTYHGHALWSFLCDCGKTHKADVSAVKDGSVKSCGCLNSEQAKKNGLLGGKKDKHGQAKKGAKNNAEYQVWKCMRQRCKNQKNKDFPAYGGRGISVAKEWDSFEVFLSDMGEKPSAKHSIDRIDTNGNYCKSNCRWADDFEQASNRRTRGSGEYAKIKEKETNGI